jgi:hypothetical protein
VLVRNSSPLPSVIDVTNTKPDASVAAIEGTATSTATGNSATDAVTGVLGTVEPTAPGSFSAGVRGVNNSTSAIGIGVAGFHEQSGWGVYGHAPTGYGVLGEIASNGGGGAGMRAAFSGNEVGTALELSNGRIKVAGDRRPSFRADLSTTCGTGNFLAALDNPLINGDPNAMLHLTPTDSTDGGIILAQVPLGVVYVTAANPVSGCPTNRWLVKSETGAQIPDITVNVLAFST